VEAGFNGVETVGAINDFIRDSIKDYYKNIQSELRAILIDTYDLSVHGRYLQLAYLLVLQVKKGMFHINGEGINEPHASFGMVRTAVWDTTWKVI